MIDTINILLCMLCLVGEDKQRRLVLLRIPMQHFLNETCFDSKVLCIYLHGDV